MKIENVEVIEPGFETPRTRGLCPPREEQIETCRRWIRMHCVKSNLVDTRGDRLSYSLKHLVEEWSSSHPGEQSYVSNGAFIVAAHLEGYRVQRDPRREFSLNAFFDMEFAHQEDPALRCACADCGHRDFSGVERIGLLGTQ